MAKDFYENKDQRIFYVCESSYGTPQGGTAWTAPSATYPHWQRMNIIQDTIETPVPVRKKTPYYDVGAGKHPSHVVAQMYEPTEISFDMLFQDAAMFAYAIGNATHAGKTAQISTITCVADTNDSLDGTYFFVESVPTDDNGTPLLYCVWIDTDNSGTAYPGPTEIGATEREEITGIATNDNAATVAGFVDTALDAIDMSTGTVSEVVTITNDYKGSCMNPRDSQVSTTDTGFTFATTTEGDSTITITENLGRSLKSFTMYVQQKNQTGASEDLVKVFFGCVISSWTLTIDREAHVIKQSVTIKSPYAIDGTVSTEPPPINKKEPMTWNMLQTDEKALAVSTTSYLPKSTTKISLTIDNNVEIKAEVGSLYNQHPISAQRDVSLNVVGFTDSDDLYDLFEDTWNNDDGYLETLTSQLDSDINIERTAATDYVRMYIYNWYVDEHDFKVFSVSDAIKAVDITMKGGTPDITTNTGELFTNGSARPTVVSTDSLKKYHNT